MRSDWKRIMVIGCGGSGKTSLACKIGKILGIDVIHLDSLFWKPGWVEIEKTKWTQIVEKVASRKQWIIDGNYSGTIDIRLSNADTVIFLDMPRFLCLWQVIKRRILFHGKTRPDITDGCPESLSWEFVKWIWQFPKRRRPQILAKLTACRDRKKVVVLHSSGEITSFLKHLKQSLRAN